MWRYRELMPLANGEEPFTLGEGWTPTAGAHSLQIAAGALVVGGRPIPRKPSTPMAATISCIRATGFST